jgi:hypothetical protein
MSDLTLKARLVSAQQANTWLNTAYATLKPYLIAGHVYDVSIKPETRSSAENALLHAMLTYISKHREWAGKKRDVETWKRLLIAAWSRATGEHVELLPALDGHGVDIVFRRSSQLTRKECADLIEFVYAWGAQNDVEFPPAPLPAEHIKRLEVA